MEHLGHWEQGEHQGNKRYFGNVGDMTGWYKGNIGNIGNIWDRHKKRIPYWDILYYFTNLPDYFTSAGATTAVSTAVVSAFTTAESTATAVESVVASVVPLPPHATNVVAIAKIAITFFIFCLFKLNCFVLLFIVTLISIRCFDFFIRGPAIHQPLY
jgi:hypothetical protein